MWLSIRSLQSLTTRPYRLQDCVELFEERLGPTHPNTIDAIMDSKSWRQNIA
ncbi:hypothetical protein BJX62DRAFT_221294 [Aspergillus germanicus]